MGDVIDGRKPGPFCLLATVRFYTRGVKAVHKTEHLSAASCSITPVTSKRKASVWNAISFFAPVLHQIAGFWPFGGFYLNQLTVNHVGKHLAAPVDAQLERLSSCPFDELRPGYPIGQGHLRPGDMQTFGGQVKYRSSVSLSISSLKTFPSASELEE